MLAAAVLMMLTGAGHAQRAQAVDGPHYVTAIQVDPKRPDVVYASLLGGSQGAVVKSTDRGRTWSAADIGLTVPPGHTIPIPGLRVDALAIDPRTPNVLYAGTGLGVYKTSDGAKTWKLASTGIGFGNDPLGHRLAEGSIWALAVDPTHTSTVYAAGREGVFKSMNGGATWRHVLRRTFAVSLGIDPRRPASVYVGVLRSGVIGSRTPGIRGAILKTIDGGDSWRPTGPPGLRDSYFGHPIVVDGRLPGTIYAGGSRGLFASRNDGRAWSNVLPLADAFSGVIAIALDPSRTNVLRAGTTRGFVTSDDVGQTWSAPVFPDRSVSAIAIARTRPQTIYAGMQQGPSDPSTAGVFVSVDGGSTWRRVL